MKSKLILKSVLHECIIHNRRMNSAYNKISKSLPFDAIKVKSLCEDDITYIDQYIYRFSKLQDAIGNKLFKSVLTELGEDPANKPIIDLINRLEKLEIINTYDNWKELRDLRNEAAHDYEDDPVETAEKLNLLFEKKIQLESYLTDIINYLSNKNLL